jgi:hypothetical protein
VQTLEAIDAARRRGNIEPLCALLLECGDSCAELQHENQLLRSVIEQLRRESRRRQALLEARVASLQRRLGE